MRRDMKAAACQRYVEVARQAVLVVADAEDGLPGRAKRPAPGSVTCLLDMLAEQHSAPGIPFTCLTGREATNARDW